MIDQQKPIEIQQITRSYIKWAKPVSRLNKTELIDRFEDRDIPVQT